MQASKLRKPAEVQCFAYTLIEVLCHCMVCCVPFGGNADVTSPGEVSLQVFVEQSFPFIQFGKAGCVGAKESGIKWTPLSLFAFP